MNEQMAQMMMQMMLNNQQMTQMMFQLMTQPQPNPVQETQSQIAATPTPQMMAQTGAAAVNVIANGQGEMADLKNQIEALKQQLADAKSQLEAANARASSAEAQAAQIQAQYDQLLKDVGIVEVSQGRSLQEIVEESQLMTGDDYYDRNREEYQNMNGQEAHELIKDKMDIKDDWIKQNSTEEEYEAYRDKLHQREKEQYLEKNGIVDFSKNMVDITKMVKRPDTDTFGF